MVDRQLIEDLRNEVVRTHGFLMGAAGAAIAFAMHQTAGRLPSASLVPAFIGVSLWAFSFWAGIMNSHAKQTAYKCNHYLLLEKQGGMRPDFIQMYQDDFDKSNRRSRNWYYAQLYGLLIGAVFYVGGHVWHIFEQPYIEKPSVEQPSTATGKAPQVPPPVRNQATAGNP